MLFEVVLFLLMRLKQRRQLVEGLVNAWQKVNEEVRDRLFL